MVTLKAINTMAGQDRKKSKSPNYGTAEMMAEKRKYLADFNKSVNKFIREVGIPLNTELQEIYDLNENDDPNRGRNLYNRTSYNFVYSTYEHLVLCSNDNFKTAELRYLIGSGSSPMDSMYEVVYRYNGKKAVKDMESMDFDYYLPKYNPASFAKFLNNIIEMIPHRVQTNHELAKRTTRSLLWSGDIIVPEDKWTPLVREMM